MKILPSPPCVLLVDVGGHSILVLPITNRLQDEPPPQDEERPR